MPTCGPAGDGYKTGIAAIIIDIGFDPTQRRFAIDDVIWVSGARTQAISHRAADPTESRHVLH